MMNKENLEKIAQWLEAGAPHAVFSMEVGIYPAGDPDGLEEAEFLSLEDLLKATSQPADKVGACGSMFCIAGAAYLMSHAPEGETFPSLKRQNALNSAGWEAVRNRAHKYLGLEYDGSHIGHNIFDHSLAPANCTPQQAAEAVRRVIDGKDPWE